MDSDHRAGSPIRWLKWLGRSIGLAASAFFLAFIVGEGVPEIVEAGIPDELLLFIPPLLLAIAGCVIALFRARSGGVLQVVGGSLMSVYHLAAGGLKDLDMAVVFGVPFIVAGLITVLSSRDRVTAVAR